MSDSGEPALPSVPPEFEFIEWIKSRAASRPEVPLGIGDDASLLETPANSQWVTTVDVLTEGRHFTSETSLKLVGRKSLAVNISDIAAMGARPVAAFVGLVLPQKQCRRDRETLYEGLFEIANEFGIVIAGGDTNSWDGPLVVSVTLMGLVEQGQGVLRSGASPGDRIYVTGALGGSLESGRHLSFMPRVNEAQVLRREFRVTAMMDLSDGLASDLRHLARHSGVGVLLRADCIPIHSDVSTELSETERLRHAFNDGEDFELLFTLRPDDAARLERSMDLLGVNVTEIGECTENPELQLTANGVLTPFPRGGWSHPIQD